MSTTSCETKKRIIPCSLTVGREPPIALSVRGDIQYIEQKCLDAVFEIGIDIDGQEEISLSGVYGDGLRCGVEDKGYHQGAGYEAAEYGFGEAVSKVTDYFYGEQDTAQGKIIAIARSLGLEISIKKEASNDTPSP